MFKPTTNLILTLTLILATTLTACRDDEYIAESLYDNDNDEYDATQVDDVTYPDWTESTHSNAIDPNVDLVFDQDEVMRLDITISSSDWSDMWSELSTNLGSSNMGGMNTDLDFTPMWAPCTVTCDGIDWYEVGIRFKGNSSLSQTYSSGNDKLSLKLDFDQYEKDYPALANQRFYGFKQLNLNNNYEDLSFMREKVASDLFRDFGMVAANTRFCAVYLNYGTGEQYYGLYTLVEEVDDSVIKTQFSDGSGNAYKPEADAGSFASGTYDQSEFNLKTNTDNATYSDVSSLYTILHSSDRTSNTESWMSQMESVFNVDVFVKWLAVITTIQNWDSYGNMAHNYYLYNNPDDQLLTWIPWDHNESLQDATGNYKTYTPTQLLNYRYVSSSSWPLIRYILDIDEYKEIFDNYLQEFIDDLFNPTRMSVIYQNHYNMIKEYVYAEERGRTFLNSDAQFESAVSELMDEHAQERYDLIDSYLND